MIEFVFVKKLLKYFDIHDNPVSISAVPGGLLHKLYKVQLESGEPLAVKCLNPTIMKRETALSNMIFSEKISAALQAVVPAVVAMEKDGIRVHKIEEQYFMVFPWLEGRSIFPPDIREYHCTQIGELLGKIHCADVKIEDAKGDVEKESEGTKGYDWQGYLELAKSRRVKWLPDYESYIEQLVQFTAFAVSAGEILKQKQVISHRDLDPKNVLWHGDAAYIIDWEAAGFVNPFKELLEVINYWADDGQGGLQKTYFDAIISSYQAYVSLEGVDWDAVLLGGYEGMLDWLAYNIRRGLGLEATDEEEKQLGELQIRLTIQELQKYTNKITYMKKWIEK